MEHHVPENISATNSDLESSLEDEDNFLLLAAPSVSPKLPTQPPESEVPETEIPHGPNLVDLETAGMVTVADDEARPPQTIAPDEPQPTVLANMPVDPARETCPRCDRDRGICLAVTCRRNSWQ